MPFLKIKDISRVQITKLNMQKFNDETLIDTFLFSHAIWLVWTLSWTSRKLSMGYLWETSYDRSLTIIQTQTSSKTNKMVFLWVSLKFAVWVWHISASKFVREPLISFDYFFTFELFICNTSAKIGRNSQMFYNAFNENFAKWVELEKLNNFSDIWRINKKEVTFEKIIHRWKN